MVRQWSQWGVGEIVSYVCSCHWIVRVMGPPGPYGAVVFDAFTVGLLEYREKQYCA